MEKQGAPSKVGILGRLLKAAVFALTIAGIASLGLWALEETFARSEKDLTRGRVIAQLFRMVRAEQALGVGGMKSCKFGTCREILSLGNEWEVVSGYRFSVIVEKRGALVTGQSSNGTLITLTTWESE